MTGAADAHAEHRRLSSPSARFGARAQGRASAAVLQARLVEQESRTLAATLARHTASGEVLRAAALVVGARRRFVTGAGKSFAYATLLAADLSAALSQVTLVDDTIVGALDVLTEVRDTDVLVAFSFRRYRRTTLGIAEQFVAGGGTLVAVTDDERAPLARHAAVTVVVGTDSASWADSPTAVAATVHLLGALTTASAKGARRRLADRDRISGALGVYVAADEHTGRTPQHETDTTRRGTR
ncbi:MurR/RpiR family transcriptional regulator [Cellulomonas marina]|uniref:DNA-binding transcriptional regulator, MurR/RpiR family, contains HTH and SIS domains n=1 Tax=Cellulomonas marina TaxID=988821 RepID=A0A1I0Z6A7_9CELL|nr:SIS domain-containing protein [Cellulomonas marina]GIG28220.1 hypothetical protein Cma02nite_08200 [Cellulomonas marina]SFB20110.1 DNA-binding transcriptional regulator, MurR/RpiR family, contains HTH and SIS domains [Cellulomonas marina]